MKTPASLSLQLKREELPLALAMFAYFFLVITCFWILKPIKKGMFIQYYDRSGFDLLGTQFSASQAELLAKMLNMGVAFAAVVVFSYLSRYLRRQQLSYVFCVFFIACYAFFAAWLAEPAASGVWSFYLFGDLFSTLMVATGTVLVVHAVEPLRR